MGGTEVSDGEVFLLLALGAPITLVVIAAMLLGYDIAIFKRAKKKRHDDEDT